MIVGVPKEVKDSERRVSTTPAGAHEYHAHGHRVIVERGAGVGSGFSDAAYIDAGAEIAADAAEVFGTSICCGRISSSSPICIWPPTKR
jgi:alanine dehydrogenase